MNGNNRIIVGITGASGTVYGIRALELLRHAGFETHLVVSKSAGLTLSCETDFTLERLKAMADQVYGINDVGAAIASGSFRTRGMIVVPCSIRTMSDIAHGSTSSLLTRAADVVMKERRRLVLMVRETPLHLGHLKSMVGVTEMGAIVMPPVPAFYAKPVDLEEMVTFSVGRALDLFDIDVGLQKRWKEPDSSPFRPGITAAATAAKSDDGVDHGPKLRKVQI